MIVVANLFFVFNFMFFLCSFYSLALTFIWHFSSFFNYLYFQDEEAKELSKAMMSKKTKRIYGRMQYGIAAKEKAVNVLVEKRRKREEEPESEQPAPEAKKQKQKQKQKEEPVKETKATKTKAKKSATPVDESAVESVRDLFKPKGSRTSSRR